jgi:hypothetical protein
MLRRIDIPSIIRLMSVMLIVAQVRANDLQMHELRFFLDPNLVDCMDTNELMSNMTQYAEDVNNIFAKQTIRRMVFDPNTGITITNTKPYSEGAFPPFPEQDYELWVHAILTDVPNISYGGHSGADMSGAGVAWGLKWDKIYNPSELTDGSRELEEYWFQIHAIVHEFEHVFGAGSSEYYNLNIVSDMTGVEPIVDIKLRPTDPYWNKRQDYFSDPLLLFAYEQPLLGSPSSLQELRNTVAFAEVTVAVVNRGPRNWDSLLSTLPDLSTVKVQAMDARTNVPISSATVRVWNVNGSSYENEEIQVTAGETAGTHEFYWDSRNAFNTSGHLKLVKVFAPDYRADAVWFSVFDAVEEKMVHGRNELIIPVHLMPKSGTYLMNMHDFALMAKAWLSMEGQEKFDSRIDLYSDGVVDHKDLEILTNYWLKGDLPQPYE